MNAYTCARTHTHTHTTLHLLESQELSLQAAPVSCLCPVKGTGVAVDGGVVACDSTCLGGLSEGGGLDTFTGGAGEVPSRVTGAVLRASGGASSSSSSSSSTSDSDSVSVPVDSSVSLYHTMCVCMVCVCVCERER